MKTNNGGGICSVPGAELSCITTLKFTNKEIKLSDLPTVPRLMGGGARASPSHLPTGGFPQLLPGCLNAGSRNEREIHRVGRTQGQPRVEVSFCRTLLTRQKGTPTGLTLPFLIHVKRKLWAQHGPGTMPFPPWQGVGSGAGHLDPNPAVTGNIICRSPGFWCGSEVEYCPLLPTTMGINAHSKKDPVSL